MCGGSGYIGSFQNCTFHSTTLYAVHGASVTLETCNIHDAPAAPLTIS